MAVTERSEERTRTDSKGHCGCGGDGGAAGRKKAAQWKKPVLEDVSGKVMAQPYIRFT